MINCPHCSYVAGSAQIAFCPQCGNDLIHAMKSSVASDRLKHWGGELRILSTCFVGFVGFDRLMQARIDSEVMLALRNCLFESECIIKRYDGTSNQIIPDLRVLGVFGAPKAHADDPFRAVRCAWEIRRWWADKRKSDDVLKDIHVKIGLNTGPAFFGYILERGSFLTVIGDTINSAARLTEMCPPDEILMSDNTFEQVKDVVEVEYVGAHTLKGKKKKIEIYNITDVKLAPSTPISQRTPVFGRRDELARLLGIARNLKQTKERICIITGQMGIGKTRLKEEFEKCLSNQVDCTYLETHCSIEVPSPYFSFRLLLRRCTGLQEGDSQDVIARRLGDFVVRTDLSPSDERGLAHLFLTDVGRLTENEMRVVNEEIHAAVLHVLEAACRVKPLVLIFEEFNKADEMSRSLMSFLARELQDQPLMFLLVNVPREYVEKLIPSLEEINLAPLPLENVQELISHILKDVDENVVQFLFKSAGGNPLFTIEAIRNTRRTNLIRKISGRWVLEKEQRLTFLDDLYGVVMSTIDSLPSDYRMIIDYASVIGYNFSHRILKELFDVPYLKEQLRYLIDDGYIVLSEEEQDPVYVFRHNLMKDAAYAVLPLRKRKEIHRQIAQLYETLYHGRLSDFYENIGYHYLSCDNFAKAAHFYKLAGDKAKNLCAIERARDFYDTVLKIHRENPEYVAPESYRGILLHYADIHETTGDIAKMQKSAEQGLLSAQQDNETAPELVFKERIAYGHFLNGTYDKAEEQLLLMLEQCPEDMTELRALLHSDLGILYQRKYEYEKGIINYTLSWNIASESNIAKAEILCLFYLALLHRDMGNYEQALEYLTFGLDERIPEADLRYRLQFDYLIADVRRCMNFVPDARKIMEECMITAHRIGHSEIYIESALDLAFLRAQHDSDGDGARQLIEQVDRKISRFIRENLFSEINYKKALVYCQLGNRARAQDFAQNALNIARKFNHRDIECNCLLLLSQLVERDRLERAQEALDIADSTKLPPLIGATLLRLTQICKDENDIEKARYYGRKALLVFDDIKYRLSESHQKVYGQKPEHEQLLEL